LQADALLRDYKIFTIIAAFTSHNFFSTASAGLKIRKTTFLYNMSISLKTAMDDINANIRVK